MSGSMVAVYADEEAVINSSDMIAITTMSRIANEKEMPELESPVKIAFLLIRLNSKNNK